MAKKKKKYNERFNTRLNDNVLKNYQKHAELFPSLLNDMEDYDTQGFYKNVYNTHKGDFNAITQALTPGSETEHIGTDRFKKPNHPTFSKESKYHIPIFRPGGYWQDDYFVASNRNIKNMNEAYGSPMNYMQWAEDYDRNTIPDVGLKYKGETLIQPEQKSNGGKITNMKKKKSNNLPKYGNGSPGVPGNLFNVLSGLQQLGMNTVPQFDYSSLNQPNPTFTGLPDSIYNYSTNNNSTLGNQNPNANSLSSTLTGGASMSGGGGGSLANAKGGASMGNKSGGDTGQSGQGGGPLGGVMELLNGPLAPLAGMAMNSVTDMIKAINTPERERRPVLKNAASYTFENGGTIKIKPSKKGTFTAAAKKRGKSVQAFASQVLANKDNYSPAIVKKANFARNAAKWKKAVGGMVKPDDGYALASNFTPEFVNIPAAFDYENGGLVGNYMDAFDAMAFGGMIDPSMYMQQMMYGSYAQGGQVPQNIPVEVEGEEMYEMPNGQVGEFSGPKHENGGMPMALPEGTKIYSDRLKVNGKTMAARKDKREANINKLERLLTKNPNDKFIKEALKRQQETNALEESQDMQQQEMANEQQAQQEMAMEEMLMGAAEQDMQEGIMMAMGGMIKRADGSYSQRGLWDNIRANAGSGKKPTKEMLAQEKKIRAAEKAYGGMVKYADGGFVDDCPDGYEKDDNGNCIPIRKSKMMGVYGRINEADKDPFFTQRQYNETRDRLSTLQPQTTKITDTPPYGVTFNNLNVSENELDKSIISNTPLVDFNPNKLKSSYAAGEEPEGYTLAEDLIDANVANSKINNAFQNALMMNNLLNQPTPNDRNTTPTVIPEDITENLAQLGFFGQKGFANYPEGYGPKGKLPTKTTETYSPDVPKKENKLAQFFNNLFSGNNQPKSKKEKSTRTNKNTGTDNYDFTKGDKTGMFGTSVGMYGPALMTMLNRMETPPNVNFYSTFGQDALATQEEAEGLAGISKDEAYRKNLMRANALRKQLANSARGVGDIRSGQLAAELTEQEGARGILGNYLQGMAGLKSQRANLQQQIDQTRMGGEQQRDLADRQDLDQFYTNLAENVANASNMMQKQGRDLNVAQYNKDIMSLSKAYSKYGVYAVRDPKSGLLTLAQKDADGKIVYLTEDEVKELPKKQPEVITTTVKD